MKNLIFILLILLSVSVSAQRNKLKNITEKNGKIGIGTTQPDELLTVKGKVHAQEVIVDLNGAIAPDYVFESYYEGVSKINSSYHFLTLPEIEAYTKKFHHIPKIPSANEMEKNGLSLKEMNLILLEKIEELTLYTIQQQKEIDLLKEKVSKLNE
jgi:hypothetical protein